MIAPDQITRANALDVAVRRGGVVFYAARLDSKRWALYMAPDSERLDHDTGDKVVLTRTSLTSIVDELRLRSQDRDARLVPHPSSIAEAA